MPHVSAIVLAAGKSERMGRPKLLLPIGETTMIGNVLDSVLASSVHEVIVVVGHQADAVREAIGERRVRIVHNPDYEAGMFSSVLCGLEAVAEGADAVLLALGDQPNVPPSVIDRLIEASAATDKGLVVPSCVHEGRKRRGHPVLIDARYIPQIRELSGDQGLRELFVRHHDDIEFVPFDTPVIIDDLDTPEDYDRLERT
jgi:molybdenum cofactor cytidylyltransferase